MGDNLSESVRSDAGADVAHGMLGAIVLCIAMFLLFSSWVIFKGEPDIHQSVISYLSRDCE